MAELAESGQQRCQIDDLEARLRDLTGTVAEVKAKILAAPIATARAWNWQQFDDEHRAAAFAELDNWIRTTLTRYPHVFDRLRPCWREHGYAVDALSAAYGTWLIAMSANAKADHFASWLNTWLPSLESALRDSLGECGTGRHVPDEIDYSRID